MINWNRQGGRVYPQAGSVSQFIARIFRGIAAIPGTGAWRMTASNVNPLMSASNVNPSMSGADTIPIMTGADI